METDFEKLIPPHTHIRANATDDYTRELADNTIEALQAAAEMQKRLKELEEYIGNLEEGWAEQNEEWEREVAGLSAENERLRERLEPLPGPDY